MQTDTPLSVVFRHHVFFSLAARSWRAPGFTRQTRQPRFVAKEDSVANRRLAFARTRSKEAVGKLFNELGPRYEARPGGYIRIMKCGFRPGDNAPMAYVELVDRPEASDE